METNDDEKNDVKIEETKEPSKSIAGDMESSHSGGSRIVESREDRIKKLKEQSESERQRKLAELMESQKQSNELRQKQQIERRKKIEELKLREEERRKGVEQRRKKLDEKEKEKTENLQKRSKEREARAALSQKHFRAMSSSMSQSMISPRQNRMTMSINSNCTSSGSEKCMRKAGYGRWPSSCDVDKVSSYVSRAAGKASCNTRSASNTRKQLQPPEGFLEVDGHFIPASTRHVGCFMPYKGPRYHVKGVLAWGPPRNSSLAWWAAIDNNTTPRKHQRASSAHNSYYKTCPSIPINIDLSGVDYDNEISVSPHLMRNSLMTLETGKSDIKSKLSNRRNIQATPPVKIIKAFSQHHLHSNVLFCDGVSGKEINSPRVKHQSGSRSNVPAATSTNNSKASASKSLKDDSATNRLSKAKSDSQPPKTGLKESLDGTKVMSTSVSKQHGKNDKVNKKERKAHASTTDENIPKITASDLIGNSGLCENIKDTDTMESVNTTIDEFSSNTKSGSRKNSKHLSKIPDVSDPDSSPVLDEELAYKQKLAEQRRIAREKKEQKLEEQKRIGEEARQKAVLERKKLEEETRMVIEEEAKRSKLFEEERQMELEKQRLLEESEKKKKEEELRKLEEDRLKKLRSEEEARMDRKKRLEKIMSRVKPTDETTSPSNEELTGVSEIVETLNISDLKNEPLVEISLDETLLKSIVTNQIEEDSSQPTNAWIEEDETETKLKGNDLQLKTNLQDITNTSGTNSPELISETVLNLPGPQSQNSCVTQSLPSHLNNETPSGDQRPQFKSKLLQSMLGSGRLNTSKVQDDRPNNVTPASKNQSLADLKEKRNSLYLSPTAIDTYNPDDSLSHSQSYHAELSHVVSNGVNYNQAINGLSQESESEQCLANGNHLPTDTYTLSNLSSNVDLPRIPMDKMELRSESTCSQFSSDECPPPMPPHSQALELS